MFSIRRRQTGWLYLGASVEVKYNATTATCTKLTVATQSGKNLAEQNK